MKAIVLAAGMSTRTYPLTLTRPKPLLPLLDRPLLAHTLEHLAAVVEEAVVVVNYRAAMIEDWFGDAYADLALRYVMQHEPRGTADAVAAARGLVGGEFLVVNGDDYYAFANVEAVAAAAGAAVLGAAVGSSSRFGVLKAEGGRLAGLDEKPRSGGAARVNAGLYKVTEEIFEDVAALAPSPRGELEFTAALMAYAARHPVAVVAAPGPWFPIGAPADLLSAQLALWPAGRDVIAGARLRLDAEAQLGPRCVLGDGCEVGAGALVETSLLLDRVRVADGALVTGSVLGEGAVVEERAMVNGAALGDGARVGVGARLAPGARVWPRVRVEPGDYVTGDRM